jgi:uncharacterized protein YbcI
LWSYFFGGEAMPSIKAALEAAISDAFIKFQRKLMGRGPAETRTYIIEDMVLVRFKGVLTVEESHLAKTDKGRQAVKEMRKILRETYSQETEALVSQLVGCHVISSHSDISTKTGERVEIYVLNENLGKRLKEQEKSQA